LDEFVVMPNHIHGILIIDNGGTDKNAVKNDTPHVGTNDPVGTNDRWSLQSRNMELIPKIISQYKSSVTRTIRQQSGDYEFGWQKSYHDRIIRSEKSLNRIRNYIRNNPVNWGKDRNNREKNL
jgi:REP element-mobilizing transposase RayT